MSKKAAAVGVELDAKTGYPFAIGDSILVRTVTMYQLGRVVAVTPDSIVLTDASWIADVGRLGEALANGCAALREVERCPAWVCVGRGSIVDLLPWAHDLPTATK